MGANSRLLPLDHIRPDMELAEAVRDRLGNVMLPAGVVLTEHHLEGLRQRGVAAALIKLEAPSMTPEERNVQMKAMEDRLEHIFRLSLDNPLNRRLKDLILAYRMEHFE
jgi:hypothetical protein